MMAAVPAFASVCPADNVAQNPAIFQWTYHPVSADNPEPYYSGQICDAGTLNCSNSSVVSF